MDPAGLAAAVQRLAAEPALRRRLVAGGLRTAATFTVEQQARAIERCLQGTTPQASALNAQRWRADTTFS